MTAPTICVVTGSRAEYGLLRPVIRAIAASEQLELRLLVTGMHLSARYGETWRGIVEDGYGIDSKVPMLVDDDSALGISRSMGAGIAGIASALQELAPDLMLVLGDRFEVLAAVQAALIARVPVAHLCGGDVTEGAWDDSIRHAVTKMSHLHFPSHVDAGARILQMGEDPAAVHVVGSPGIDSIQQLSLLDRDALSQVLDFRLCDRNLLITYHPETLDSAQPAQRFVELLTALEGFCPQTGLLFTMPNADAGGHQLFSQVERFVADRENARVWVSMGQLRYLSAMSQVDAVVGNSSSGLYEAPSLGTPTVNIGGRQDGRPRATSVIDCDPQRDAIEAAIQSALERDCDGVVNPYGDGRSAARIVSVLESVGDFAGLVRKRFVDREVAL